MLKKRKTLRDIAEEAGVSMTSVSLYLNGKAEQYRLSKELCARLQQILARENFTPNVNARAMNAKRTNLIGCILRDEIQNSFWADIFAGMEKALSAYGLHILPALSHASMKNELSSFDFLRSKGVDAFIWVPMISPNGCKNVKKIMEYSQERPVVSLTCHIPGMPGVCVDDTAGARLALEHLLALGHRQLASFGKSYIFSRTNDFLSLAQKQGATCFLTDFASEIIQAHREGKVTAVFCFSDNWALELYKACAEANIRIPQDLSIVGYDNLPISEYILPGLTTIHQPKQELGEETGKLLQACLIAPTLKTQLTLQPSFMQRDSTAAPGSRR